MAKPNVAIFDRISFMAAYARANKKIAILGVRPDGAIIEDHEIRGDLLERNVSNEIDPFFKDIQQRKNDFADLGSLNKNIGIFGPISMARSNALLEWMVFSGVVDTYTQLEELRGGLPLFTDFYKLCNSLNGENNWNGQNMVIDFQHNLVIYRNMSRTSNEHNKYLAKYPIVELKRKHDLFVGERRKLRGKRKELREVLNAIQKKASKIAFDFLKELFFK